jgi:hypothetical protein
MSKFLTRLEKLEAKFSSKIEKRNSTPKDEPDDYHPVFSELEGMEIGEEVKDDIWRIIRVPNGWIVKGLNFGTAFIPLK